MSMKYKSFMDDDKLHEGANALGWNITKGAFKIPAYGPALLGERFYQGSLPALVRFRNNIMVYGDNFGAFDDTEDGYADAVERFKQNIAAAP